MSAETDLRALLVADVDVAAITTRFAADRVEQETARPFGVYTRAKVDRMEGLDGTVFAVKVTIELQLWADSRAAAEALADVCRLAVTGAGQAVVAESAGYDGELDLEASILTIEWWE